MEHGGESSVAEWTAPECPFRIEYAARVLDDVRLAVVDAFFSLPRGGAEIGGVLLGKWENNRVSITGYEALDCEHALGPSFTLSTRDQTLFADMIARARRNDPTRQPVGWYHSHTRSEIFLSDADQDIHNRYFPEWWQVALVLKPHTFEPTRGGFFFREPDGSMRGAGSYQEFQLEPLPHRPPSGANGIHRKNPRADAELVAPVTAPPENGRRKVPITREIAIEPPPATVPEFAAPDFDRMSRDRSWRAIKGAAILALGLAAGAAGYQTRAYWLPKLLTKARAVLPKEPDTYLALALADDNGQLRIQWDRNAQAVRNALEGTIEITDGAGAPQSVRLDGSHFASGTFTYARQSERVEIVLLATQPDGSVVKEQSFFLGKLPAQKAGAAVPQGQESQTEKEQVDRLQRDSNFQAAKIRKLEKDLQDARGQLQKSTQAEGEKK